MTKKGRRHKEGDIGRRLAFCRKLEGRRARNSARIEPKRGTPEWYAERKAARDQATAAWEERVRKALLRKAAKAAGKPYVSEKLPVRQSRATSRRFRQFASLLAAPSPSQVLAGVQAARRVRKLRSYLRRRARALLKLRRYHAFNRVLPSPGGKLRAPSARRLSHFAPVGALIKTLSAQPPRVLRRTNFITMGARQLYRAHQRAAISVRRDRHQ